MRAQIDSRFIRGTSRQKLKETNENKDNNNQARLVTAPEYE